MGRAANPTIPDHRLGLSDVVCCITVFAFAVHVHNARYVEKWCHSRAVVGLWTDYE